MRRVEVAFTNLLLVTAVAFAAPLALGFAPAVRMPAVVLEIVAGIVGGPSGLGWAEVDGPVAVLSVIGLAFLLFLAGLEIEFDMLRGRVLRVAALGFALSFGLAIVIGVGLQGAGLVDQPVFFAILASATSLGIVVPVLKDADQIHSPFGQLVVAGATIADFATIILLSLLFSREASSTTTKVLLLALLAVAVVLATLTLLEVEHSAVVRRTLQRLQDTTAQIRVRGAFLLLVGLVALATSLGLEVILGAFLAGAVVSLVDHDEWMTHPLLRTKLEAVGFGVFVPVFFVSSGLRFDLGALGDAETLARIPVFVAALLVIRGVPALLYRPVIGSGLIPVAGLLQATSLPFIVAATTIGRELDVVSAANQAALIAAGLVSVVAFPALALVLLRRDSIAA